MVGDLEVNLTASLGVCVYPDFANDVDTLLERADAATYAAKENGRNQYKVFADAMLKASQERLSMDTALRHALAREEMYLHYQPIVSLTTGRVIGMESLIRWHHPKLGPISPGTFIPLAEETGQIVPIGEWALNSPASRPSSSARSSAWTSPSPSTSRPASSSSPICSSHRRSPPNLRPAASQLQIELTENTLMINSASNLEKLQRIREMGARVAIDDFGTGFCSFSYLLQYPVDRLKIDSELRHEGRHRAQRRHRGQDHRRHVPQPRHQGHRRGRRNPGAPSFLADHRCDEVQGFLFSRPIAASGFVDTSPIPSTAPSTSSAKPSHRAISSSETNTARPFEVRYPGMSSRVCPFATFQRRPMFRRLSSSRISAHRRCHSDPE